MAGWLTCPADYLWIRSVRELIAIICLLRQRRQTKTLGDRVIGHHDDPLGDMIRVLLLGIPEGLRTVQWGYLSAGQGKERNASKRLQQQPADQKKWRRRRSKHTVTIGRPACSVSGAVYWTWLANGTQGVLRNDLTLIN